MDAMDFETALANFAGLIQGLGGAPQVGPEAQAANDAALSRQMTPPASIEDLVRASYASAAPLPPGLKERMRIRAASQWSGPQPQGELRAAPTTADTVQRYLDYGAAPAKAYVGQIDAAAKAASEATDDPSLANVTNAAARGALVLAAPRAAIGALTAGYAGAAADDLGLYPVGAAHAAPKNGRVQAAPDLPGLTPEQNAEYQSSVAAIRGGQFSSGAERRYHESIVERYGALSREIAGRDKAQQQAEYGRAVEKAEAMRDRALEKDRRFSDTATGQYFEKTGGLTPVLAGAGAGMLSRAASGPGQATIGKIVKDYLLPAASGGLAGATVANAPVYYDAYQTEPDNPQKRAYEAYARELPPDHPRKREWMDYAQRLPDRNPVREQAQTEFREGMAGRMTAGALEGAGGGIIGADIVRIPGRAVSALRGRGGSGDGPPTGGGPGTTPPPAGGQPGGPPPIPPGSSSPTPGGSPPGSPPAWGPFPKYSSLPQSVRDAASEAYLAERILQGRRLPEKGTAEGIKTAVNAPVTPKRVSDTNDVVAGFEAQHGRPPTRAEFNALRTSKTLAVPLTAGGAGITALVRQSRSDGDDTPSHHSHGQSRGADGRFD